LLAILAKSITITIAILGEKSIAILFAILDLNFTYRDNTSLSVNHLIINETM